MFCVLLSTNCVGGVSKEKIVVSALAGILHPSGTIAGRAGRKELHNDSAAPEPRCCRPRCYRPRCYRPRCCRSRWQKSCAEDMHFEDRDQFRNAITTGNSSAIPSEQVTAPLHCPHHEETVYLVGLLSFFVQTGLNLHPFEQFSEPPATATTRSMAFPPKLSARDLTTGHESSFSEDWWAEMAGLSSFGLHKRSDSGPGEDSFGGHRSALCSISREKTALAGVEGVTLLEFGRRLL